MIVFCCCDLKGGPHYKRIKVIGNNGASCLQSNTPAASASIVSAATVAVPRPHHSCYSQCDRGLVNGCCGYGGPGLTTKGSALAAKRDEMLDKLFLKKAQKQLVNCDTDVHKYHPLLQKRRRPFVKPIRYDSAGCGVCYWTISLHICELRLFSIAETWFYNTGMCLNMRYGTTEKKKS